MPESRCFCCLWKMIGFGTTTTTTTTTNTTEPKGHPPMEASTMKTMSSAECIDNETTTISAANLAERIRSENKLTLTSSSDRSDDKVTSTSSLSDNRRSVFILDCRPMNEFEILHIVNSINITLPTILQKRLIKGTLSACSVISAKDVRELFSQVYKNALVVLIEEEKCHDECHIENNADTSNNNGDLSLSFLLLKKLREEGCTARFIEGGLKKFFADHPDLCQVPSSGADDHSIEGASSCTSKISTNDRPSTLCYLDMKNMKLDDCYLETPTSSLSSSCASSSCSNESCYASSPDLSVSNDLRSTTETIIESTAINNNQRYEFEPVSYNDRRNGQLPAQIKPYLFLGNSINSSDLDTLEKYNIKYILNVTPNLPNVFENDERFHYMKIPIDDHWSQNLFEHFPKAISFIDEARSKRCGVLVHCLAGISRSVTVIVAYLMYTFTMNLEDAYDLVKSHKPNIAPNLNFMGQLLDFQRQLFGVNPPDSVHVSPILPIHSDENVVETHFLTAPLSAPPTRTVRRTKQTAECF